MNSKHTLSYLITLLAAMLWPAHANAQGSSREMQKQAEQAYIAYFTAVTYLDDEGRMACADSLEQAGEQQHNYQVKIYAHMVRSLVYMTNGQEEEMKDALAKWVKLARENNDRLSYYEARQTECRYTFEFNPSMSAHLAKKMIEEANEEKNIYGQVYGYKTLGDIYSWRGMSQMAIHEFEQAIEICKNTKAKDLPENYIYINAAQEYCNIHRFDRAQELLDKAYEICMQVDQAQITEINVLYAFIEYDRNESTEKFFHLYDIAVNDPYYEERIDPIMQQQLQVSWLIRKGRAEEALAMAMQIEDKVVQLAMRKECMENMGNYKEANALSDSVIDLRDSLTQQAQREDMELLDKQIGNSQLREQNSELERHRIIIGSSLGGTLLLVIIGAITFINRKQRRHNAILSEKNVQLKKANDAKTHFIQNMTHELHTPINAINGFSSMLADPEMAPLFGPDELAEMNRGIADSAMSLTHIIDDIVALTDYENPSERPFIRPCSPQSTIDEALKACPTIDADRLTLHTDLAQLPPDFQLNSNAGHDKRVLANLIGNAIKFTPQGDITVGAYIDEPNDHFVYYVQDTGPGIPEGQEEAIFERFRKLNEYIPGTGLGLPVARIIANMLGGNVVLDTEHSHEGEGARFLYILPLHAEIYEGTGEKFSYNAHLGSY